MFTFTILENDKHKHFFWEREENPVSITNTDLSRLFLENMVMSGNLRIVLAEAAKRK